MLGLRGAVLTPDNPIVSDIRDLGIGGVVLFDSPDPAYSNIQSPGQLRALTAALQEIAPVPLFVAVDQEGGNVARLKERYGFRRTVSQEYLAWVEGSQES